MQEPVDLSWMRSRISVAQCTQWLYCIICSPTSRTQPLVRGVCSGWGRRGAGSMTSTSPLLRPASTPSGASRLSSTAPAKIDLRYSFGALDGVLHVEEIPPIPRMPFRLDEAINRESSSSFDGHSISRIVDMKEPTLLQGSDSLRTVEGPQDDVLIDSPRALRNASSMGSRPSDGQLNADF